jgi:hypothetical protein
MVAVKLDLTDDESNGSLERSHQKKSFWSAGLPTICFAKAKIRKEKLITN